MQRYTIEQLSDDGRRIFAEVNIMHVESKGDRNTTFFEGAIEIEGAGVHPVQASTRVLTNMPYEHSDRQLLEIWLESRLKDLLH